MPRQRVVDGGHGVLTDHTIRRLTRKSAPSAAGWQLRPFRGYTAGVRELGLAYAEAGEMAGSAQQLREAERLLHTAAPDAQVWLRLADLRSRRNDYPGAAAAWEAALKLDPNSVVALVNLGAARGSAGDLTGAEALWKRALEKNPAQPEATRNLYRLYRSQGRHKEADLRRTVLLQFEPGIHVDP
jgi:tetratricopeptide (TPR) repeat protein